jgi:hypothetical protein
MRVLTIPCRGWIGVLRGKSGPIPQRASLPHGNFLLKGVSDHTRSKTVVKINPLSVAPSECNLIAPANPARCAPLSTPAMWNGRSSGKCKGPAKRQSLFEGKTLLSGVVAP